MARPRIFVSSTYYDLKVIREDLDRFITSLGYEPVRHERGHISYGKDEKPESYAYREIEYCDILVSVIGGKFGTTANESEYSISQQELKKAHELGKQVYMFVDSNVHSEFKYYQANKDVPGVRYTAVNDPRVYTFLEEVYALPKGNPIFTFETGADLTTILREQLAGLLQRLLVEESNRIQTSLIHELQRSLQTVDQLVKFLTEEKINSDVAVQEILFSNHPVFEAIKTATKTKYRLYFTNLEELNDWLGTAKGFSQLPDVFWDSPDYMEWSRELGTKSKPETQILWIKKDLFDADGKLKVISQASWHEEWVRAERREPVKPSSKFAGNFDDDIPF